MFEQHLLIDVDLVVTAASTIHLINMVMLCLAYLPFFYLLPILAHFTITSNKEEMGAERICESMYEEGWASISRQDTARGVDRFVGILLQYHTEACHHTVVEKCLWSIVDTASPSGESVSMNIKNNTML